MGTPDSLMRCIKACITTPMFSICVNGELTGFFSSTKGVRQGDPLSSFLFLIAMEAFFFFWIVKNLFPKRAMPQQTMNDTMSQKATRKPNRLPEKTTYGQHLP